MKGVYKVRGNVQNTASVLEALRKLDSPAGAC